MSFLKGEPFIATEAHMEASWLGGVKGKYFRCALCGYKFQVGDIVRCQYTNDVKGASGNPLVCIQCDGTKEEIVEKWTQMHQEAANRMWWFCSRWEELLY